MNSFFSPKKVSKSHITEQRFVAYSKANNYIKHLVSFYDQKKDNLVYDESSILHQIFKEQTPVNSIHKLSLMPKSSVACELEDKIKRLNAFHNLSEKKSKKPILREKQPSSLSRKGRNTYFSTKKYNSLLNKLSGYTNSPDQTTFVTTESKYVKKFSEMLADKQRASSQIRAFPKQKFENDSFSALPNNLTPKLGFLDVSRELILPQFPEPSKTTRFPTLKTLKSKKKSLILSSPQENLSLRQKSESKYRIVPYPDYLMSSFKDAEVNT